MTQKTLIDVPREPRTLNFTPKEWKIVALRECPMDTPMLETPEQCADYWNQHITSHPFFNRDIECLVELMLNTRRRIIGHLFLGTGTLDTLLVHPREVFRPAIIAAAADIILMHNHPSGDSTPSDADIKVTRELVQASRYIKIDILDHLIIGRADEEHPRGFHSLREHGYFDW